MSVDSTSNNPDMDVTSELCLEDFKTWSTMALKMFLSLKKKTVTGSHETLSARWVNMTLFLRKNCRYSFFYIQTKQAIHQNTYHVWNVSFLNCQETVGLDVTLLKEYKDKLKIDDSLQSLPDPMELKTGWVGEGNGMKFWPHVYVTDSTRFYKDVINKEDLIQRIDCEYKQSKVYWYFTNKFIHEVFINNVSEDSKCCILQTKFLPSQRISQKPYTVWAIVRRDER